MNASAVEGNSPFCRLASVVFMVAEDEEEEGEEGEEGEDVVRVVSWLLPIICPPFECACSCSVVTTVAPSLIQSLLSVSALSKQSTISHQMSCEVADETEAEVTGISCLSLH